MEPGDDRRPGVGIGRQEFRAIEQAVRLLWRLHRGSEAIFPAEIRGKVGAIRSLKPDGDTTAKLVGSHDAESYRKAWEQFTDLYGPALKAWAGRYKVPGSEVPSLVQEVLVKLLQYMKRRDCRYWLGLVAGEALVVCAEGVAAAGGSKEDWLESRPDEALPTLDALRHRFTRERKGDEPVPDPEEVRAADLKAVRAAMEGRWVPGW